MNTPEAVLEIRNEDPCDRGWYNYILWPDWALDDTKWTYPIHYELMPIWEVGQLMGGN